MSSMSYTRWQNVAGEVEAAVEHFDDNGYDFASMSIGEKEAMAFVIAEMQTISRYVENAA